MTEKESVLRTLREQKEAGTEQGVDLEAVKTEWLRDVAVLMAKIGEWLQPAVADELLTTNTIESVVFDEHLGSYKTQGLRITTPKGQRIDVKPHARFIMEFEGRVDLLSGPKRGMFLRTGSGEWTVGVHAFGRVETTELTEDAFWGVVRELLA